MKTKHPPKQRTAEQQLQERLRYIKTYFNRAKSLFSLKHIQTVNQLVDIIGDNKDRYDAKELLQRLTSEKINDIERRVLEREESEFKLRLAGITTADVAPPLPPSGWTESFPKVEEFTLDSLYTTKDFELESTYYKGYSWQKLKALSSPWLSHTFPPDNPRQVAVATYFQEEAAKELYYKLTVEGLTGLLLRANTGDGKTYCIGRLLRWIIDSGWMKGKSLSPFKILYVTKASIVTQTTRDLEREFGIDPLKDDIVVTNYEQLRAELGEMVINETVEVVDTLPRKKYTWKSVMHPLLIIWDECQALKNEDSIQSKIAQASNELPPGKIYQIFVSATPFAKVASAKCFCVATHIPFKHGLGESPLDNLNWSLYSKEYICGGTDPNEFSRENIKNLLKMFSHYIVGFKNVRRKFKAINKEYIIDFETPAQRQQYEKAWEAYLAKKAELEGPSSGANSRFLILVEFLKFRQAAEFIRAEYLAKQMYHSVTEGFAPLCACNFKPTIAKVILTLHQKYGVQRSDISVIWGGSEGFSGKEAKYTQADIQRILGDAIRGVDIPKKVLKEIYSQLSAQHSGLSKIPPELDLGTQSRKQRQKEIDRFQSGKSHYCFFTFGAGGAGLSLHHKYEHTCQRRTYLAPTYNEMELAQGLGRAPRLTSLSDTEQIIFIYRDTIEERVLASVMCKTGCLIEVIKHSQSAESSSATALDFHTKQEDNGVLEDVIALSGAKQIVDINDSEEEEDDESLFNGEE